MDTILDFLVDNYIWVLIISVFLILVLIGYIADQKRKLKKLKKENEISNNNGVNINTPINEEISPINEQQPVVEQTNVEPVRDVTSEPVIDTPITEPIEEVPIAETTNQFTQPLDEMSPINENNEQLSDITPPVVEDTPQTILDIPDSVEDVSKSVISDEISNPVEEIIEPINTSTSIIDEPEIIDEPVKTEKIADSWEPELIGETTDIINTEEDKSKI